MKSCKGGTAAIFKLKEQITGKKKTTQEATTLIDPETKSEVNSVEDIKRVSLEYCKDLLTNRAPSEGFEDVLEYKMLIHEERMKEVLVDEEFDLSFQMFNSALNRIKSKNAKKYAFILNGGPSLKFALFRLFQSVWTTEVIPESWKKTNIVQIFKGKGSRSDVTMYRNLHTKKEGR